MVSKTSDFGPLQYRTESLTFAPSPLGHVLEGTPVARRAPLPSSPDNAAVTWAWDCTAGRFRWYYDEDETVHVVTGEAQISFEGQPPVTIRAGDVVYFPAGSQADWTVDSYIRKVAFCRKPLPYPVTFVARAYWRLKRDLRQWRQRRIELDTDATRGAAGAQVLQTK